MKNIVLYCSCIFWRRLQSGVGLRHVVSNISNRFNQYNSPFFIIKVTRCTCRQLSSRSICSCSTAVYKPVWHIPLLSVQWINFWWWTEELSETYRVSCQNKFLKLVHLVGFITKTHSIEGSTIEIMSRVKSTENENKLPTWTVFNQRFIF